MVSEAATNTIANHTANVDSDWLLDRVKRQKQLKMWRIAALVLLLLLLFALINKAGLGSTGSHIARIHVDGFIDTDLERDEHLQKLADNDSVKAVIMHVNSPGGTTAGGENLFNALYRLKQAKPLVVVMDNMAASAAYLAALSGDHIIASRGTITGSIGVIFQSPNVSQLADKIGVDIKQITSGDMKGQPNMLGEFSPESEVVFQELVDDFHAFFIQAVANERKMDLATVEKLADGRIYTGNQASKNGLIDAIGDEQDAITWLEEEKEIKENLKVVEHKLRTPKDNIEKVLGIIAPNMSFLTQKNRYGLLSVPNGYGIF